MLWINHSRRLVLRGVAINGVIIRSDPETHIALGESWQSTFDQKVFDPDAAGDFLKDVGDCGSFSEPAPPNFFTALTALNKSRESASVGPDGISIAAWRRCPRAPSLLLEIDSEVKSGSPLPPGFNHALGWFLAKGGI